MATDKENLRHGLWLRNGVDLAVKQVVQYAIEAEKAGWDGVFVSDAINAPGERYSDPWTALAAVAVRTKRIRLGTWITPVPQYQPWRLAHTLASLDQLSDGRVLLGAGLGAPYDFETFYGSYDPQALGRKYDEALEVMTGLWGGEPFSFSGEFFTVEEAKLGVLPKQQPRIPILMGCWWPNRKPFRRAARWDGIMPFWPALLGEEGRGPQGEERTGSVEQELRALMAYYRSVADEPGEVLLPDRSDSEYRQLCKELGATWLLDTGVKDLDEVWEGPARDLG